MLFRSLRSSSQATSSNERRASSAPFCLIWALAPRTELCAQGPEDGFHFPCLRNERTVGRGRLSVSHTFQWWVLSRLVQLALDEAAWVFVIISSPGPGVSSGAFIRLLSGLRHQLCSFIETTRIFERNLALTGGMQSASAQTPTRPHPESPPSPPRRASGVRDLLCCRLA